MTHGYIYRFSGALESAPYPGRPVQTRNIMFPLLSAKDYAVEAAMDPAPDTRSFMLPTVNYLFLSELIETAAQIGLTFDLILVRLPSPNLEPIPSTLLASNVFLTLDADHLLDLAQTRGRRRILYIGGNFSLKYVNEFGDNSFDLSLFYDQNIGDAVAQLTTLLAQRGINGALSTDHHPHSLS